MTDEAELEQTEEADTVPHLVFEFGDDKRVFPAYEHYNQALLYKHRDALARGDMFAVMALTEAMTLPEHRGDMMDYLVEHGNDEGFIDTVYAAMSANVLGDTNLPLAPSQDS